MIRRYNLSEGDNAPAYAHFKVFNIYGSGELHIDLGWAPTGVEVAFSRQYLRIWKGDYLYFNPASYGVESSYDEYTDGDEPQIYVRHDSPMTTTGFWIQYRNIPGLLDINYYAQ